MNYTKKELEKMMKKNGGWLYLSGTAITTLPDNLTVGGSLDLRDTAITSGQLKKVKKLKEGDHTDNYIYCDGILTHIKRFKKIGKYTFYAGKIKGKNVVTDGEYYAHCEKFKDRVTDIEFKTVSYTHLDVYKRQVLTFKFFLHII